MVSYLQSELSSKTLLSSDTLSIILNNYILFLRAPVAQLVEHWAVMREVVGLNPDRIINTQDLKIIEEKVLPL